MPKQTNPDYVEWRDIAGYSGYQVSSDGRVRSRKWGAWRMLKPGANWKGYLYVILSHDHRTKSLRIHRLVVAGAFGKEHKDVMRAIGLLECSAEFNQRNFAPVEYLEECR